MFLRTTLALDQLTLSAIMRPGFDWRVEEFLATRTGTAYRQVGTVRSVWPRWGRAAVYFEVSPNVTADKLPGIQRQWSGLVDGLRVDGLQLLNSIPSEIDDRAALEGLIPSVLPDGLGDKAGELLTLLVLGVIAIGLLYAYRKSR
jgi:hypothetical protein